MYSMDICFVVNKATGNKRYFRYDANGIGQMFKTRISKDKYLRLERSSARSCNYLTKMSKSTFEHSQTVIFDIGIF